MRRHAERVHDSRPENPLSCVPAQVYARSGRSVEWVKEQNEKLDNLTDTLMHCQEPGHESVCGVTPLLISATQFSSGV